MSGLFSGTRDNTAKGVSMGCGHVVGKRCEGYGVIRAHTTHSIAGGKTRHGLWVCARCLAAKGARK